jgi:hypothetical protein
LAGLGCPNIDVHLGSSHASIGPFHDEGGRMRGALLGALLPIQILVEIHLLIAALAILIIGTKGT